MIQAGLEFALMSLSRRTSLEFIFGASSTGDQHWTFRDGAQPGLLPPHTPAGSLQLRIEPETTESFVGKEVTGETFCP